MISFSCGKCGKIFSVDDKHGGKSARCKACGHMLTVPAESATTPSAIEVPKPVKIPMRTRRLTADAVAMATTFAGFEPIRVTPVTGDPPEVYHVEYQVHSLDRGDDGKPVPREMHKVEIQLTSEYPRLSPRCKMLTPIFHPNIDPATICVGDHWTAGERLADLVIRIGEMIAYQQYNIQSPLDAEAAMWADLNRETLPTDSRDLHPLPAE